ncbi:MULTISPECIES: LysR substrate-binding domain-containing protein [Pandoraea]|uniref:LysR family transcriptional regulator n=2 Tax=Pandoraea TaxID=93217 RepID=A0A5E4XQE2_9BURK|nr:MULTISPECIES: LysR substrate-binding domain-containing protein [Pandoraea]ALS58902.1 LysR family transcriptional regulator [Pandoraea norimbergensis]VVE38701.1 LysR family transcriptional regulator [Pandoraea iniqua]VVE44427.1 LysR family transcriptional regulator [Pandoraea iniqua]
MDFRHVDAFRALMLTRTTTKAAQVLGTSQSAVSRLVADLERLTRLTLFDRARGRLEPTAEALALFEEVERRYAGLENIREFALNLRNPDQAVIRVGSVVSFGLGYFARVMAGYRAVHPSVQLALVTGASDLIRDQVVTRQIALGLLTDTKDVAATDAVSFAKLDAICALPAGHPLARKKVIRLADLKGQPILSYEPTDMVRWGMDQLFIEGRLHEQVVATARYSVNIGTMVKEKLGIGLLHPVAAYDFLDSDLVLRRFEPSMPFHTLRVTPRSAAPSAQIDDLVRVMETTLDDVMRAVEDRMKR